jgi:hypothetical protein
MLTTEQCSYLSAHCGALTTERPFGTYCGLVNRDCGAGGS